jgi:hypothetical protein
VIVENGTNLLLCLSWIGLGTNSVKDSILRLWDKAELTRSFLLRI